MMKPLTLNINILRLDTSDHMTKDRWKTRNTWKVRASLERGILPISRVRNDMIISLIKKE